jgi:hypothetical protein
MADGEPMFFALIGFFMLMVILAILANLGVFGPM